MAQVLTLVVKQLLGTLFSLVSEVCFLCLCSGRQPKDNPRFFCGVVTDLAQYFHSTSSRKSRQLSSKTTMFSLDKREVTWLCFHAFYTCLRKKQSRYVELLRFLRMGLSCLGGLTEEMKKITDPSQHAVFKDIR